MKNTESVPPQIQAILNFQKEITHKSGRNISISEAIAGWIALGFAEQHRKEHFFKSIKN
jgi:hypothetical protein